MSLLGKILALLNLLGAAGLVYVAAIDYGKRQSWAHANFRHELVLRGLPVDDEERDEESVPLVELISDDDRNDLFKAAGANAPTTQVKEVQRLKDLVDGTLREVEQNRPQQTYRLARILLPLSDNYLEREQLLACRTHLATDATAQALKAACRRALERALEPGVGGALAERPFSEVFRAAFRAQGTEPADVFLSLLLRQLGEDRTKVAAAFDKAYEDALEAQRAGLKARCDGFFAEALGQASGGTSGGSKPGLQPQKAAIARLLFGLCQYQAEEAALATPTLQPAYQEGLLDAEPYRPHTSRFLAVCGLRSALGAISERASVVRRLGEYAAAAAQQERQQFVLDHDAGIGLIREQAELARTEQALVNDNRDVLARHTMVVNERKAEINKLRTDLQQTQTTTASEMKQLRDLSEQVLRLRVKIRDAITATEKGEQRIRELEKRVRELDRQGRE